MAKWDEDSNDADDVQATADDVQATADDVQATVAVDVDDGVNYSDYGKVKDEDSDEDANETLYDGYKAQFSGGEGRSLSLKDNIYVGQSFASRAEFVSKLKSVAVEYKFTFSAYKTTKTLYVAKCRVQGCGWKLRASVKHGPKTFWSFVIYARVGERTAEDGYENLPSYLRQIEISNPGTVTCLVKDGENRFKYLFLSFAASIAGFNYLRRVIVVDGTHLCGKYEGFMLVAAAQDGNFQIFPLAFAIVDVENDESWEWFFTQLRRCVSDQYALVIVSDRHGSIKKACEKVFPWARRGICYYHLQQNIVQKFKGKHMLYLVKGAAYAHTLFDFNHYMDEIRIINPNLATYLENADVSLWSRVHFQGDRYNIKTSNIAESINSALKPAKGFPISFLLEFIREKLGRWFFIRREDALSLTSHHSRGIENLLAIREEYADMMNVERIDGWRFVVRGGHRDCVVDLELRRCQCGVFDIEKIPSCYSTIQ
ncbi:PREDICTED: uncharacterized protein LOC106324212 [Brassica oleracea var. oleracea]|uniref:uncharacterized protein LOC106324212 n=1 Tax=Brassica oleracea var. oleracea TaxID=109376 RepID=UPI0006A6FE01|nr:PREDICTED: uncharacterized protein LOC106324212 [Brassica oleracea var. oleracea]